MAARGAMQQVEIVEPVASDAAGRDRAARRDERPAGLRRVPRWAWFAALAAVVALGSAQVALDAHGRAVDARLARIVGAVAPLDGPPRAAWTVQGADADVLRQGLVADGVAVGVRPDQDGSRHLVAIGLGDGRERWTATLDGPDALRARTQAPFADAACKLVAGVAPAEVACVTTGQVATFSDGLLYVTRSARRGHLVVLDVATGRRVIDRSTLPTPAFVALPGALVLAQAGRDGHTHLTAQDLATGTERWTSVSPVTVPAAVGEPLLQLAPVGLRAFVVADGSGAATVVDVSGRVLSGPTAPLVGWSVTLASDTARLVAGAHVGSGDGIVTSTSVHPGRADVQVSGRTIVPTADDGSLAGLVVTTGHGVRAYDATSGRALWATPVEASSDEAVVLGGTVVLLTDRGLVALDGGDGHVLWRAAGGSDVQVTDLRSDGRSVLAVEATSGGAALAAFAPSDGRLRWSGSVPSGDVRAVGRALVAFVGDTATRLGS